MNEHVSAGVSHTYTNVNVNNIVYLITNGITEFLHVPSRTVGLSAFCAAIAAFDDETPDGLRWR